MKTPVNTRRVCEFSPGDRGKIAEGLVADWLDAQSAARQDFAWQRFPDARAARGALAAQPCDFLVGSRHGITLLEVKETANEHRLPKAKISQYGALKKWSWTGSVFVLVVIYRSYYDDWTFFDKGDLFQYDETPPSFPFEDNRSYVSHEDLLEQLLP